MASILRQITNNLRNGFSITNGLYNKIEIHLTQSPNIYFQFAVVVNRTTAIPAVRLLSTEVSKPEEKRRKSFRSTDFLI